MSTLKIVSACEAAFAQPTHRANCSGFARAVAAAIGVPLGASGQRANDIHDEIGAAPWVVLGTGEPGLVAAGRAAAEGHFVVAAWKNPRGHGHVAVVTGIQGPLNTVTGHGVVGSWGSLDAPDAARHQGPIRESFSVREKLPYTRFSRFAPASSWRAWNWKDEGFLAPPQQRVLQAPLTVYRVWGGLAGEEGNPTRPGVCYTLQQPKTRREAERLLSIWEWGNAASCVTTFQVAARATIFIGRVHPGDDYIPSLRASGSQVFIEMPQVRMFVRKVRAAVRLTNDLRSHIVVPYRDPGLQRSS